MKEEAAAAPPNSTTARRERKIPQQFVCMCAWIESPNENENRKRFASNLKWFNFLLCCVCYLRTITTDSVSISSRIHAAESLGRRRRYAESALFRRETYPVNPSTWLSNLELNVWKQRNEWNKRLNECERANQHGTHSKILLLNICTHVCGHGWFSPILTEELDY